jgi:formylglycine-generating enzyme required for sulfatase activity
MYGSARCDGGPITVTAFDIDIIEVTVAAYHECVNGGACSVAGVQDAHFCNWNPKYFGRKLEHPEHHPMNCVDVGQSQAYCAWAGKRLPRHDEWEWAARGPDGRVYPWGDDSALDLSPKSPLGWRERFRSAWGCWRTKGTCPVGSYPALDSPFGLKDTAGNVSEWTSDAACDVPELCDVYSKALVDPRAACGTSWADPDLDEEEMLALATCSVRPAKYRGAAVGFRCARSVGATR